MTYTAIFRDGPLGGQYREVERPEHIIRVPVFPRINAYEYKTNPGTMFEIPGEETYELTQMPGSFILEYRWVNPSKDLRAENERLKAKLARIEMEARYR